MDTDLLKYDGTAMGEAADKILKTHNTLVNYRDDLNRYVHNHVTTNWESNSANAYQSQQDRWDTACDDVQIMLMNLYNALEGAIGNAGGLEHQLEQLWQEPS